jgi:SAM-dependent methyltransferase
VEALATLATNHINALPPIKNIVEVFGESGTHPEDSEKFGAILRSYGSDKSTTHNYYIAYASLLAAKKDQPLQILEIGLGTNNIDVPSNMGTYGRPGASLRSFRDMYKHATIWGADIDSRILFSEERIQTFYVDQTQTLILQKLKDQLGDTRFDLIIDDGLHNSQANLNTLNFALGLLKPDGYFVVEDVDRGNYQYYQIAAAILSGKFAVEFLDTISGTCICIFKKI